MNIMANAFAKAAGKEQIQTDAPLSHGHRRLLAEQVVAGLPQGKANKENATTTARGIAPKKGK